MTHRILIVEDEPSIAELIAVNLSHAGFLPVRAFQTEQASQLMKEVLPDLVVLDWMLPGKSGVQFAKELRANERTKDIPIILLTARSEEMDKIAGLEAGADDYLTKPFNLEELLLRVSKLIQKTNTAKQSLVLDEYSFAGHTLNFKLQEALNNKGEKITLTKKESMLLQLLIENKNTVVTRERILQSVWGYQVFPTTRTIDNFILSFRKYFEQDPKSPVHFISIRGVGYKFQD